MKIVPRPGEAVPDAINDLRRTVRQLARQAAEDRARIAELEERVSQLEAEA